MDDACKHDGSGHPVVKRRCQSVHLVAQSVVWGKLHLIFLLACVHDWWAKSEREHPWDFGLVSNCGVSKVLFSSPLLLIYIFYTKVIYVISLSSHVNRVSPQVKVNILPLINLSPTENKRQNSEFYLYKSLILRFYGIFVIKTQYSW